MVVHSPETCLYHYYENGEFVRAMSAISRGIARLSKRRKKQRELPAIIEQDHTPDFPPTLPAGLEEHNIPSLLGRSMDRLRKSIRQSFRRNRSQDRNPPIVNTPDGNGRSEAWQPDEAAVRAGICSFPVKYLGSTEVYESRGMPVCEGALKHLRSLKRHPVKAILYVSGDGLRVVDQENSRGLMVDQTIEKVSFCAPDRNNDKGFAYICRDGTSRRWMCHGFHASKDTGERLSHAVGCAFAICLERKKKRDEENMYSTEKPIPLTVDKALNPDWGEKAQSAPEASSPPGAPDTNGFFLQRTNNAYQSFRKQISISERLQDPQSVIVNQAPSPSIHQTLPCIAKPRPAANPALFQRQGSLRAPEVAQNSQFRRNFSLRGPQPESPKRTFGATLNTEPIYEGDEDYLVSVSHASTSQYASAPVAPMQTNFPTFMDYSSAPHSATTNQMAKAPALPLQPQPDLLQFNDILDFNKPISVNTQYSPPGPASPSQNSRADDWLNQTLKTSLSFGSPNEMSLSPSMGSLGNGTASTAMYANIPGTMPMASPQNGTAPVAAPPPLPQRPPGVAASVAPKQPAATNGIKTNGTDSFGQAVNWEPMSPRHVPKPEDPFDIQWSKMAISANNPFASEQPRITI